MFPSIGVRLRRSSSSMRAWAGGGAGDVARHSSSRTCPVHFRKDALRDRNRARRAKVPSIVPMAFPYYRPRPLGPDLSLGWLQRGCHMTGDR